MQTQPKRLPFVFKVVSREVRGALQHFVFFLLSIAIGVGSIVGVGNLAANFEAMTQHEAKNLLAADVEVKLDQPLSESAVAVLDKLAAQSVATIKLSELIGMASNPDTKKTQLVEVKAVGNGYPYYGPLIIEPELQADFQNDQVVYVEKGLLQRLKLEVGQTLNLGDASFKIRGIVLREPDKVAGPFSIGPRVLLSQAALTRAALVQRGSRVRHRLLMKVGGDYTPDSLTTFLEEALSEESVRIKTYRDVRPRLRRFLDNFTTYLSLVGLITLMIGGIGVGGNVHAFLTERIQTIAILKSLGCDSKTLLLIYLSLVLFLGAIGAVVGIALGVGICLALVSFLGGFMPPGFVLAWEAAPMFQALAMGLLTTLLFSVWPLRVIGAVSPARVFRVDVEALSIKGKGGTLVKQVILIAVLVMLWSLLAMWQAQSWKLGGSLVAGILVAVLILVLSGRLVLALIKKAPRPKALALRYGISNLYRPGRQVMAILVSLGIAVMVLLTLKQVENNLLVQLEQNIPEDAPGLFLIDIQSDQKEGLLGLLASWTLKQPTELSPLIRSRLDAIDGKKISEMDLEGRRDAWYFTREYVLTYKQELPNHNLLQRGLWWDAEPGQAGDMLSVEVEAAKHLGIDLGSELDFDIQGISVSGKISSVRAVDWGSMTTNFYFIFPPEALAGAPETYVATITSDAGDDQAIQNAVIDAFPNITIIPIRELLETIARILSEIAHTVEFMAALSLLVGLVVVSGAIAATRRRQVHELVLLKILGATRAKLMLMMGLEYTILGLIAATVGGGLSVILSWVIVQRFLDIPWQFEWQLLLWGSLATVALTVLTGFLVTYRRLGEKPNVVLRTE